MLLGIPHLNSEDIENWQSIALLLQTGVVSKKKDLIDQSDIEKFAKFSLEFEQANVLTPILSVYEIQPTKTKVSRFASKKLHVSI